MSQHTNLLLQNQTKQIIKRPRLNSVSNEYVKQKTYRNEGKNILLLAFVYFGGTIHVPYTIIHCTPLHKSHHSDGQTTSRFRTFNTIARIGGQASSKIAKYWNYLKPLTFRNIIKIIYCYKLTLTNPTIKKLKMQNAFNEINRYLFCWTRFNLHNQIPLITIKLQNIVILCDFKIWQKEKQKR